MAQDIAQGWANLRVNEKNARINEFKENLKAEYPNITQIPGKLWNDLMIEIDELFGSNIWKKQKSK